MDAVPSHLAAAVATVRAFAAASGAERVVLIVDQGMDRDALMLDCDGLGAIEVTEDGRESIVEASAPPGAAPRALPELRPAPATAIAFDAASGQLEAPLGVIANLATGVLALASAFGGRSVASVDFSTRDPDTPLTIAAREGDPVIVASGEHRFELPPEAML
ncbi:MAG: hypothetical protein QOK21_4502 [Solirubrobacteraceae bacterium]|jgi:hypothetical protein|nr:hypothetical protein [Solirubrobacteraceae bacterium]